MSAAVSVGGERVSGGRRGRGVGREVVRERVRGPVREIETFGGFVGEGVGEGFGEGFRRVDFEEVGFDWRECWRKFCVKSVQLLEERSYESKVAAIAGLSTAM